MAFQKVRLTHPKDKYPDVVAASAIDKNNFVSRDGYVVAEDQSDLDGTGEGGEKAEGQSPPEPVEERTEQSAGGTATDAEGEQVATA